ncbi:MAG: hypothetical protein CM1200mP31_5910 [Candidatus Neomarinimicrobiota bacterium]|nr:MAG: hypothetical protein CM1200mP31_5910 [Candidatus Neomarinimicrobiota bacterium]
MLGVITCLTDSTFQNLIGKIPYIFVDKESPKFPVVLFLILS